ncbi:MAG: thioredoxin [Clostridia bacterium]|nr:thioredoxin [Clostridia bacterium]
MELIHLTEENFDAEVKNAKGVVLVDFYADWCGPCKLLAPTIEDLAATTSYKICKCNVDDAPEIAQQFDVMSIPTLIVFKDGAPVAQHIGLSTKAKILDMLKGAE